MPKCTFDHLGAKNSFPVNPISAYDSGESQNPHFNQFGRNAVAIWHTVNVSAACLIVEHNILLQEIGTHLLLPIQNL